MKYFITGASGFIGQKLIEKLLDRGDEVLAVLRPHSPRNSEFPTHQNLKLLEWDIDSIQNYENSTPYDVFIHLAWKGTTGEDRNNVELQKQNVLQSIYCLELAKKMQCKVFFFSGSQAEYGNILDHGYVEQKETNTPYPTNEYGKAKKAFGDYLQNHVMDYPMKLYHGRIFSVYGPKDQPRSLIETFITKMQAGEDMMLGPCTHDWNFTYIDDLASMILGLIQSNAPSGIYNLAGRDTRPLKSFIEELWNVREWNGHYFLNTRPQNQGDIPLRPNTEQLRQYVSVSETSFAEGIEKTIEEQSMKRIK